MKAIDKSKKWGVVQRLEVEADTHAALLAACTIATVEHDSATHFFEGVDADGGNYLSLRWTNGSRVGAMHR